MPKLKLPLMLLTYALYLVRKMITPLNRKEPRKILVLYLSGIGDIICLSEFYRQLKRRYPSSSLWACLPAPYVKLQQGFFAFDAYVPHQSYIQTLKLINRERFDLLILPGWVLKDSILALLSNAKVTLGYINDRSFTNKFVNRFRLEAIGMKVPVVWKDMHHSHLSERPSSIAEILQMQTITADEIVISRIHPPQNHIVFHASSRLASKRWNPQHFAAMAAFLLESNYCDTIQLIGDKFDRAMNEEIIRLSGSDHVINQAGKLNLEQSKDLISQARLFLGNDSGPMHIAALSGVPTLGLMGPYPPEICRPLGQNSRYIFHRLPCTGCNPNECVNNYRCMESITPDEVRVTIQEMLGNHDQDS